MRIAIVVLNYNRKDLLGKCLKSLEKIEYKNFKIIVVDNGSEDGSVEFVKDNFPSVEVIEIGYNSGFCRGNNVGIKHALEKNFEGVMLLNNDTEADPRFLGEIVKTLDAGKKIGMLAPKILYLNKPNIIDSGGFLITPDGIGKNWGSGDKENQYAEKSEVFCPSGAATFYLRELFEDIEQDGQYFDEDFEYCYEELDLGWRARLRGWKCLFVPRSVVYHVGSATGGSYSGFFAYYSNRNLFFNIIKNYPSFYFVIKAFFLAMLKYGLLAWGLLTKKGVASEIKKNTTVFQMIRISITSFFDAAMKFPKMIKKRVYIRRRRIVGKSEINRWFKELGLSFFEAINKL